MLYYSVSFAFALLQDAAATPYSSPGGEHMDGGNSGVLLWTIIGIVIGVGIGVLISLVLRKSKGQPERGQQAQAQPPQLNTPQPFQAPASRATAHARRCPVCNSTYTDEALIYCVSDGASLVPIINNSPARDPGATLLYREAGNRDVPPTVPSRPDENQR